MRDVFVGRMNLALTQGVRLAAQSVRTHKDFADKASFGTIVKRTAQLVLHTLADAGGPQERKSRTGNHRLHFLYRDRHMLIVGAV